MDVLSPLSGLPWSHVAGEIFLLAPFDCIQESATHASLCSGVLHCSCRLESEPLALGFGMSSKFYQISMIVSFGL